VSGVVSELSARAIARPGKFGGLYDVSPEYEKKVSLGTKESDPYTNLSNAKNKVLGKIRSRLKGMKKYTPDPVNRLINTGSSVAAEVYNYLLDDEIKGTLAELYQFAKNSPNIIIDYFTPGNFFGYRDKYDLIKWGFRLFNIGLLIYTFAARQIISPHIIKDVETNQPGFPGPGWSLIWPFIGSFKPEEIPPDPHKPGELPKYRTYPLEGYIKSLYENHALTLISQFVSIFAVGELLTILARYFGKWREFKNKNK